MRGVFVRPLARLLSCGLALILLIVPGIAGAASDEIAVSRFERTAATAGSASPELQAAFTTIALEQLALAYEEEAALAQSESTVAAENAERSGWAKAVRRYARQFGLLTDEVAQGYPVSIAVSPGRPVAVAVAERRVMLSHPRPSRQAVYEQAVLSAYCSGQRCVDIGLSDRQVADLSVSAGPVRPQWSFTEDGPRCSLRGISVRFPQGASLADARTLCRDFLREVLTLGNEIAWQVRHQVAVDWAALTIYPMPGRTHDRLQLNAMGDSVLAPLPILSNFPALIQLVVPWLQGQVQEGGAQVLSLEASELGWDGG